MLLLLEGCVGRAQFPPELGGEHTQCTDADRLCLLVRNELSDDFELQWVGVWLDRKPIYSSPPPI
jgi:hypothetical protein